MCRSSGAGSSGGAQVLDQVVGVQVLDKVAGVQVVGVQVVVDQVA